MYKAVQTRPSLHDQNVQRGVLIGRMTMPLRALLWGTVFCRKCKLVDLFLQLHDFRR